jgi:hypothetical protein
MPPDLYARLLVRVRRATRAPGAKSALARALSVPRQRVSEWLKPHGASAPSAAKTLELLEWVTAAEAKPQKNAAAMFVPSQRTQTRSAKSKTNEKVQSDRRKR